MLAMYIRHRYLLCMVLIDTDSISWDCNKIFAATGVVWRWCQKEKNDNCLDGVETQNQDVLLPQLQELINLPPQQIGNQNHNTSAAREQRQVNGGGGQQKI